MLPFHLQNIYICFHKDLWCKDKSQLYLYTFSEESKDYMSPKPINRKFNYQKSKQRVRNPRQFSIMLSSYISGYFLEVLITDYFIIQWIYFNYTKLNNQIILHQLDSSVEAPQWFHNLLIWSAFFSAQHLEERSQNTEVSLL